MRFFATTDTHGCRICYQLLSYTIFSCQPFFLIDFRNDVILYKVFYRQ
jgi:hypothetical protein